MTESDHNLLITEIKMSKQDMFRKINQERKSKVLKFNTEILTQNHDKRSAYAKEIDKEIQNIPKHQRTWSKKIKK